MDWNCDGGTTIGELIESGDIGKRAVSDSTKRCIEYYTYKDTVPLRLDCE